MSRGNGIVQNAILAILPKDEEISTDYIRSKLYPDLYICRDPKILNQARVIVHRAIKSMIARGLIKKTGKNKRGCTLVKKIPLRATINPARQSV